MVHPSKHREDMRKNLTEQENYLPTQCSKDTLGIISMNTSHLPCVGVCPRANKRKNKQHKKSLLVFS
jgi:hypothetical protein